MMRPGRLFFCESLKRGCVTNQMRSYARVKRSRRLLAGVVDVTSRGPDGVGFLTLGVVEEAVFSIRR